MQQIYVSKTGNNTTGDGTVSKPYLTIAKATSMIMSNYCPKEIIIDGDYSDEHAKISGIYYDRVLIKGTNDAKVKAMSINVPSTYINVLGLTFTEGASGYGSSLYIAAGTAIVSISNCTFTNSTYGMFVQGIGNVLVRSCTFNNNTTALQCADDGTVYFINNTGENNVNGLRATGGGYIKKGGTVPSVTGVAEFESGGGKIE